MEQYYTSTHFKFTQNNFNLLLRELQYDVMALPYSSIAPHYHSSMYGTGNFEYSNSLLKLEQPSLVASLKAVVTNCFCVVSWDLALS